MEVTANVDLLICTTVDTKFLKSIVKHYFRKLLSYHEPE